MKPAFLLFLMGLLFVSCEHRELAEPIDRRYVRVYLDENIRNVHYGFYDESKPKPAYKSPNVMRVALCDPITNRVVTETYLRNKGQDQRGTYLDGHITADAGTYHLIAYNFDTESTHVRNQNSYSDMQVYTNIVSDDYFNHLESLRSEQKGQTKIIYEPDHFFVETQDRIMVYKTLNADTIKTKEGEYFKAKTVVDTYYLQVDIIGVEYVKSAVAILTGVSGSVLINKRIPVSSDPACVFFSLEHGAKMRSSEKTVAYTYFNTFPKLDGEESFLNITFEFYKKDGGVQIETFDLTEKFKTEQVRLNQWIILDHIIEINPSDDDSGSGGMNPGVNNWDEIENDIII